MKFVKEKLYEGLKEELIKTILSTAYKDRTEEEYFKKQEYLETLSEDQLDEILRNYYAYDINKKI